MRRVGYVVEHLKDPELTYALSQTIHHYDGDISLFVADWPSTTPHQIQTTKMPLVEAWGFEGVLVAIGRYAAHSILPMRGPTKKIYYQWDVADWVKDGLEFLRELELYKLVVVSRTIEIAKQTELCWGTRPLICPDLNPETLYVAANSV